MHFLRNALARAGKGQRQTVLAAINTVFAQDSFDSAIAQWRVVAYSGEDDRRFRANVTGDSAGSALLSFFTLIGHDQSTF